MTHERYTPEDYLKTHRLTKKNALSQKQTENTSRAMQMFNNLNLDQEEKEVLREHYNKQDKIELNSRQFIIFGLISVGIGALGSFLGAILYDKWRD